MKPGDLVLLRAACPTSNLTTVRWMLPGTLSDGDYSSEFPGGTPALFLGYGVLEAHRSTFSAAAYRADKRVWILIGGRRGWVWDDELEECR